jgi:hypothetical protein
VHPLLLSCSHRLCDWWHTGREPCSIAHQSAPKGCSQHCKQLAQHTNSQRQLLLHQHRCRQHTERRQPPSGQQRPRAQILCCCLSGVSPNTVTHPRQPRHAVKGYTSPPWSTLAGSQVSADNLPDQRSTSLLHSKQTPHASKLLAAVCHPAACPPCDADALRRSTGGLLCQGPASWTACGPCRCQQCGPWLHTGGVLCVSCPVHSPVMCAVCRQTGWPYRCTPPQIPMAARGATTGCLHVQCHQRMAGHAWGMVVAVTLSVRAMCAKHTCGCIAAVESGAQQEGQANRHPCARTATRSRQTPSWASISWSTTVRAEGQGRKSSSRPSCWAATGTPATGSHNFVSIKPATCN